MSVVIHTIAFYPGSFDPLTNGHLNIIQRALRVFDQVVVAMAQNVNKRAMFTLEERQALVRECFADEPRVSVVIFDGLMVDAARLHGARARPSNRTRAHPPPPSSHTRHS